jgi:competence protein ComEA
LQEAHRVSRLDRIVLAAGGGAIVLAIAAAWVLLAPVEGEVAGPPTAAGDGLSLATPESVTPSPSAPLATTIVVDIQGAVAAPGVRELPAGSRVADAIDAAGGYGMDADLLAAASAINLAQPLSDGEQIRVPRVGDAQVAAEASAGPAGSAAATQGGGGLVNLNTATPEELEALPGIGPVTVQKIVAARQEQPFASLDDAVQRGVINRGQLEDIQGVATAG